MKTEFDKFQNQVNFFLAILSKYHGANPVFEIDYNNRDIYLHDSSSGLIKRLQAQGAVTHLHNGKLSVSWIALEPLTFEEARKGLIEAI